MSANQLRILSNASSASTSSSSSSSSSEQDVAAAALFAEMAQLFQLTPLPKRRTSAMSPSVVAIDALLDDIDDPQRLLHEMVVATAAASNGASQSLSSTGSAASETRDVMVNASRARQKEEMTHLRVRVRELERELLKLSSRASSRASSISSPVNSQFKSDRPIMQPHPRKPIWERLAHSAKDRQRRAEVENLQLKETVELQMKLSKSLEKILMKRANLAILGSASQPSLPSSPPASRKRLRAAESSTAVATVQPNGDEDDRVFRELESQLDQQYESLDDVLRDTGLTTKSAEWQRCEVVTGGSDASKPPMMVECRDVKHFPFAMDAVLDAAWRCATVDAIKDVNYVAQVIHQSESVAHARTTITIKRQADCAEDLVLRIKSVVKRITEPHRHVVLLNSVATVPVAQGGSQEASSLEIADQGWATIEAISDDRRFPASILRMCMRVRPQQQEQQRFAKTKASGVAAALSLSGLLVDSCSQVLRARQQLVENFLLDGELVVKNLAPSSLP